MHSNRLSRSSFKRLEKGKTFLVSSSSLTSSSNSALSSIQKMIKSLNSIVSLIGYLSLASTASASLSAPTTPTTSGSSYIIRAFEGTALQLAADVFRVPISKNSSGGDFTFLATSGGVSESRVTPHYHLNAYETFYCQKGALNIWANGESRRLSAGDFAAVSTKRSEAH